jgi:hypothetical protein
MSQNMNQSWVLDTISATASFLRVPGLPNLASNTLDFFQTDLVLGTNLPIESDDFRFLHDLDSRILHRGRCTLPTIAIERLIASFYGDEYELKEISDESIGTIEWQWNDDLVHDASEFVDYLTPWQGDATMVEFDPVHPVNERRLFQQLLDHFGSRIASCVYAQVHISDLLPQREGQSFLGQTVDFLLSFPNGHRIVLEPGDHAAGATPLRQEQKDNQRDQALSKVGIETLRIDNERIGTAELMQAVEGAIQRCDAMRFLGDLLDSTEGIKKLSHLILLPTLIARVESSLSLFMLQRGLMSKESLQLCIVEQDIECAELALFSFLDRLRRLSDLYGILFDPPRIYLTIIRSGNFSCANLGSLQELLAEFECTVDQAIEANEKEFDLAIDVGIKCNSITPPSAVKSSCRATVRNSFPHSKLHRFSYSSLPREVQITDDKEELITSFLSDLFRKSQLREGQLPIIQNILAQRSTIGLLPTSAGKSICFQLSSILTPGITFVVDPIVFLMKDQVLGLSEQYGITKIAAWHSETGIDRDDQVGELMSTNIMVFMSPERFLRPKFRSAMKNLLAGDLFVNYAVIDEAHCVSMWGHDFRPPYLMLERCIREYCSLRGRIPVVVALTGTASQLVLIDLKRELQIEEFDSIIRPKSFDRDELTYNVIPCASSNKQASLNTILGTIGQRLGVRDVRTDAYGIIFANLPKQVWQLYAEFAGNTDQHIKQIVSNEFANDKIEFGIACGGMPKNTPMSHLQNSANSQINPF